MIIYRGRGIWAFLLILGMLTFCAVAALPFLDSLPEVFPFAMVFAFLASGSGCWILGRRWNSESKGHDTLYFIPVEYWGVGCIVVAVAMLSLMIYVSFIK